MINPKQINNINNIENNINNRRKKIKKKKKKRSKGITETIKENFSSKLNNQKIIEKKIYYNIIIMKKTY